jgi:hypothetical protein
MLQNAIAAAAVALVASALYAAARSRGRGRASEAGAVGPQPVGEELVAVIAAAIAAASGMEADAFRIVGLEPSRSEAVARAGAAPAFARRPFGAGARSGACASARASAGLNTPAWGHVDRFELGE